MVKYAPVIENEGLRDRLKSCSFVKVRLPRVRIVTQLLSTQEECQFLSHVSVKEQEKYLPYQLALNWPLLSVIKSPRSSER